jgi:anaerobic ribonucleoside-triphosphate reductase activating protein
MLTIAKFDRYDMANNPGDPTASVTIWFSGCNFRCKNCHNRKLWDSKHGNEYHTELVIKIVKAASAALGIKSVVLLGGEPLQQDKQELLSLCRLLNEAGLKIWLYTGYEFGEVDKDILQYIYTIKCGRYIDELRQDEFPASSNQKVYRSIAGDFVDITEEIGGSNN